MSAPAPEITTTPSQGPADQVADPIQTAILRSGLDAAGNEMKAAMRRSAFSPIVYDALDFACALYDRKVRLLGQGQTLPVFQGTLSFAIQAAIDIFGIDGFAPGDVVVNTDGYSMGTHGQDITIVIPGFYEDQLVGFASVKAHHMDIGGIAVFATNTTDHLQEGVIYPSIKLFKNGVRDEELWRLMLANTRLPASFAGDLSAQIGAGRIGLRGLDRVIARFSLPRFQLLTDHLMDSSEARMRQLISALPDGRWTEHAVGDNDGITDDPIPYSITMEIRGSEIVVDLTDSPPLQKGPVNCPIGTVTSVVRCAVMSLLGGQETANEGFFRAVEIRSTPGTMFHALPPAPIILYSWIVENFVDMIHRVVARTNPERVTAQYGTDISAILVWGHDTDGVFWADGQDFIGGQGASLAYGDAGSPLMLIPDSGIRNTPCEVWESRTPMVVERFEFIQDSGGTGQYRGGSGIEYRVRALRDLVTTIAFERTTTPSAGLLGGGSGSSNHVTITYPDGLILQGSKFSQIAVPAGTVIEMRTGGGGGVGDAALRSTTEVREDIRAGYISERAARQAYPHVLVSP